MTIRTNTERLRLIQRKIGVEPDGLLGPATLTALEEALGLSAPPLPAAAEAVGLGLRLSERGIKAIIRYEMGSDAYYNARLRSPMWPGGDSGVTIGIGYDLGYQSGENFRKHWREELPPSTLERLAAVCGKRGAQAKQKVAELSDISISLNRARRVFIRTSLPGYAEKALRAYPGLEALEPDAQAALVSLVYNRGASMKNTDSRREMRELRDHVRNADYAAIEATLRRMKRIWAGRGLDGLLKRRDAEADMVAEAQRAYAEDEIVRV